MTPEKHKPEDVALVTAVREHILALSDPGCEHLQAIFASLLLPEGVMIESIKQDPADVVLVSDDGKSKWTGYGENVFLALADAVAKFMKDNPNAAIPFLKDRETGDGTKEPQ